MALDDGRGNESVFAFIRRLISLKPSGQVAAGEGAAECGVAECLPLSSHATSIYPGAALTWTATASTTTAIIIKHLHVTQGF